jgi:pimeloyl-ACP methyl ester carboxylesterase
MGISFSGAVMLARIRLGIIAQTSRAGLHSRYNGRVTSTAIPVRGSAPPSVAALVDRFDHTAFDLPGARAVIRTAITGGAAWDVVVEPGTARIAPAGSGRPDALLTADLATWDAIARDVAAGMDAFRRRRLEVRYNLHLGVGFLAATSGMSGPGRLRFRRIRTPAGAYSVIEAGEGAPILMLHGLGGTKASFLPTIAALAPSFRTIAVDLLGFGDSDKPLGASYGPGYQARGLVQLLDALELDRAHMLGHSMGGRVALEAGFQHAERLDRLILMTPAMAWLRERRWAPYLRWVRPELGLIQIAPRAAVEPVMRRLIPGADSSWGRSAIDEFVRTYTSARGRAALYAAARNIYLDEPHGEDGFWSRLGGLAPRSLFIWGRQDRLIPVAFIKHVERALPAAEHVELDCGHLPQIERPRETHAAIARFLKRPGARQGG